jgi:hypothetical protein
MISIFIDYLNSVKPTDDEICNYLGDDYSAAVFESVADMYDYKVVSTSRKFDSLIDELLNNTNIREKGIADFHFVSTIEDSFAYTDDEYNFFLENGHIYSLYEEDYSLVSDSELDFIYGMLCCYHVDVDFGFRRETFNLETILSKFIGKMSERNAVFFVERLRFAYAS